MVKFNGRSLYLLPRKYKRIFFEGQPQFLVWIYKKQDLQIKLGGNESRFFGQGKINIGMRIIKHAVMDFWGSIIQNKLFTNGKSNIFR